MYINIDNYNSIKEQCNTANVQLIAVSKTKPIAAIQELYSLGHRDFGENYVQELLEKQKELPNDIRWHFIGHLQSNKVKSIIPFVHLIHAVDSLKLLQTINKEASKINSVVNCLLQIHIATEESKFGLDDNEVTTIMGSITELKHAIVKGFMGMASFTNNQNQIDNEFETIAQIYNKYKSTEIHNLSIGMSSDYEMAISKGSTMIRVGSLLFGKR